MDGQDSNRREDIFSKPVRAGKRTYFFDVKATRGNDYYLTITESKRRIDESGRFHYDKHKLFLYKEDFEKFADGLAEAIDFIKGEKGSENTAQHTEESKEEVTEASPEPTATPPTSSEGYTSDISFDDLDDDEK